MRIRHAEPADHARVAGVIDEWWGGRRMRDMLPRLFFTHFRDTSFVAEDDLGELAGFLCGFLSQTYPGRRTSTSSGSRRSTAGQGLPGSCTTGSSPLRATTAGQPCTA